MVATGRDERGKERVSLGEETRRESREEFSSLRSPLLHPPILQPFKRDPCNASYSLQNSIHQLGERTLDLPLCSLHLSLAPLLQPRVLVILPHQHSEPLDVLGSPRVLALKEIVDFALGGGSKGDRGEVGLFGGLEGGSEVGDGRFWRTDVKRKDKVESD